MSKRTYGATVETKRVSGAATLDIYAYITGERELTLLCGPHSRRRRAQGKQAELAEKADKMYRRNSKCADCSTPGVRNT